MNSILSSFALILLLTSFNNSAVELNETSWLSWQAEYNEKISGNDGWLKLAGLYWLEDGENTVGSDASNKHRFPSKSPDFVGNIKIKNGSLLFETTLEKLLVDGEPRKSALLSVEKNTRVTFNDFEFFIIERELGFAIRLIDTKATAADNYKGALFMPFDNDWLITAKLVPHKKPQTINVATVYGTTRKEKSAGWIEFVIAGKTHKLEAVDYGEDSPLYLFFSDETSGETTYPAGRYLQFDRPDNTGKTIVDFNRAYNPPCAFTPYATCPLTPPQNRLQIAINAGELDYQKKK